MLIRFALAFILFFSIKVSAFPDTVRHGYTSCFTCHYSATGGGVLRPYGKFIAGELYGALNDSSTELPWLKKTVGEPGEEINEKLVMGLFFRGVQVEVNDPSSRIKRASTKAMQGDLEIGYNINKYFAFITGGVKGAARLTDQLETDLKVRSYYVGFTESNLSVRMGKFYADYGIRHPNHNIPTRRGLFFNQGEESLNLQGHLHLEKVDLAMTLINGDADTAIKDQFGYAASVVYKTPSSRIGTSHIQLSKTGVSNKATSIYTHYAIDHSNYILSELASKEANSSSTVTKSELGYFEYGYEIKKGIIPYLVYQHTGVPNTGRYVKSYGLGGRIYPITHFEITLQALIDIYSNSGADVSGHTAFATVNAYF